MRKLNGRENSKRNNIIIFVFITILFIGTIVFLNLPKNEDISYTQLVSYIEDGNQHVDGGVYGKSITDPCLGWEKTEKLILELADLRRNDKKA